MLALEAAYAEILRDARTRQDPELKLGTRYPMAMKQLAPQVECVRRIMGRIIGGTKRLLEDKLDVVTKVSAAWEFNTVEMTRPDGVFQIATVTRNCAIEWDKAGLQSLGATSVEVLTVSRRR